MQKLNNFLINNFNFNTVYLDFLKSDFFTYKEYIDENSYYTKSLLTPFFRFIFFIATIIYFTSNTKVYRLLQFCYLITFICGLKGIYYLFLNINTGKSIFLMSVWAVTLAFVMYVSFLYLKHWQNASKLKMHNDLAEVDGILRVYASKWQRFFHLILDTFLIVIIFSDILMRTSNTTLNDLGNLIGNNLAISLIFIFFASIYYLFSEGLFRVSPAKCLTQSIVVDEEKTKVSFLRIFGRTFARRIPFNPFSFFGKTGWHDHLTKTRVALVDSDKNYNIIYWSIFALFVGYILFKGVIPFIQYHLSYIF